MDKLNNIEWKTITTNLVSLEIPKDVTQISGHICKSKQNNINKNEISTIISNASKNKIVVDLHQKIFDYSGFFDHLLYIEKKPKSFIIIFLLKGSNLRMRLTNDHSYERLLAYYYIKNHKCINYTQYQRDKTKCDNNNNDDNSKDINQILSSRYNILDLTEKEIWTLSDMYANKIRTYNIKEKYLDGDPQFFLIDSGEKNNINEAKDREFLKQKYSDIECDELFTYDKEAYIFLMCYKRDMFMIKFNKKILRTVLNEYNIFRRSSIRAILESNTINKINPSTGH